MPSGIDVQEGNVGVRTYIGANGTPMTIDLAYGEQPHPDRMGLNTGEWDHNVEVCAYEGECDDNSAECINAYTLQMMDASGTHDVYYLTPTQIPQDGAGDLLTLRATPRRGPYPPCPIGDDGRQVPCLEENATVSGAPARGFAPPSPMRFYVDALSIDNLVHISDSAFRLRVSYDIMWSDRFAVHPCRVSLYPYGGGVPASGKLVRAAEWWKPSPAKGASMHLTATHADELRVHHALSASEPGELVTEACTTDTCPWPKQLWLKDRVSVDLEQTATWELFHYPFDTQIVRTVIPVLDESGFALSAVYNASTINLTLPTAEAFANYYSTIYEPDDWHVYAASIGETPDHGSVVFEVKVARNSMTTVFKVLIPMIANSILVMLAASLPTKSRLQVVSLSMVAAGAMLNPAFLGLPSSVQGIPFVQSLVIIHLLVCVVLLANSLGVVATDFRYKLDVETEERRYHKSMVDVWQANARTFQKWASRFGRDADPQVEGRAAAAGAPPSGVVQLGSVEVVVDEKVLPEPVQLPGAQPVDSPAADDLQRATVELLLAMPALYHRQDPARPPKIWNSFGELRPGFVPEYNKTLVKRSDNDRRLVWSIPLLYVIAWIIDVVIYFGAANPVK